MAMQHFDIGNHHFPALARTALAEALVHEAQRRDLTLSFPTDVREGVAEQLPVKSAAFDTVVCAFCLGAVVDTAEALAEIRRAIELVGDDPVLFEHLGEIYLKQQNVSDAKEAWIHSLELDPANEKLFLRYREQGFGDPGQEDRIQRAKRRVSEKIQSQQSAQ